MEEKIKKPRTKKIAEKSSNTESKADSKIIAVVRIAGEVEIKKEIVETLYRLKLRKKYACTLIDSRNKGLIGMLDKVKHHVAYGVIHEKTLIELIKARGKSIEGNKVKLKMNFEEAAKEIMNGKKLEELGLKGFFRLHPPRGGIDSKMIYPKGVLGNHKDNINKLIERML